MGKVRTGTQQVKGGVTVLKASAGGLRKMRCPNCHGTAVPSLTNSGKSVYRCGTAGCRAEFVHTKM